MSGPDCALLVGASGQDGRLLAAHLAGLGVRVVGLTRDAQRVRQAAYPELQGVELLDWQLSDGAAFEAILARHQPGMVFNFAAFATGAGMFDDPAAMAETNAVAVVRMLEAIRRTAPAARFCQASSSEMYGDPATSPQDEGTPFQPLSPYGAAKLFAHHMVDVYRRQHGLFACSAILFNHESHLRSAAFVSRKISLNAARIKLGLATRLELGNLESRRDWGFAGDYVEAMHLMLQQPQPDDFVLATGRAHSVRQLCEIAFSHLGLDYREHVVEDAGHARRADPRERVGDPGKARRVLGWQPRVGFAELVRGMVDADLELLTRIPA